MLRNRNGYWMSPEFAALYAPDDGGGNGGDAGSGGEGGAGGNDAGNDGGNGGNDAGSGAGGEGDHGGDDLAAEIARLKADLAKQKEALNKATKEAGDARKALRAKQTAEEIAAEEKKANDEKAAQELDELRRKVAKAETIKSVMGKLGTDETVSGRIADCLYGADDIENAMLEIQKAWAAKEKALRLEFGKIPGPGAGNGGDDPAEKAALELAKEMGKSRAGNNQSVFEGLKDYLR